MQNASQSVWKADEQVYGETEDGRLKPSFDTVKSYHYRCQYYHKPVGYLKCINLGIQITPWENIMRHPEKEKVDKLIEDSGLRIVQY
ncbi:hypothetical protein Syun_029814 [Stephania yunnanensis]|uniref:Uncharacterized protein n=1 Tax=Stephania yunnanensis TaxID=152371 RepID=A0AAP0HLQ2_9MAGN